MIGAHYIESRVSNERTDQRLAEPMGDAAGDDSHFLSAEFFLRRVMKIEAGSLSQRYLTFGNCPSKKADFRITSEY